MNKPKTMKIGIIEDRVDDLIERYSDLTKTPYDLFVLLDERVLDYGIGMMDENETKKEVYEELERAGFKNVMYLDDLEYFTDVDGEIHLRFPEADIYFCDGLKGKCFSRADDIGKEKVYIYTGCGSTHEFAKKKGYNVVEGGRLAKILENHFK